MKQLQEALNERILILDGPMGTMIQKEGLTEQDFKGEKFKKIKNNLKGNNDLLNITCEKLIYNIHNNQYSVIVENNVAVPGSFERAHAVGVSSVYHLCTIWYTWYKIVYHFWAPKKIVYHKIVYHLSGDSLRKRGLRGEVRRGKATPSAA